MVEVGWQVRLGWVSLINNVNAQTCLILVCFQIFLICTFSIIDQCSFRKTTRYNQRCIHFFDFGFGVHQILHIPHSGIKVPGYHPLTRQCHRHNELHQTWIVLKNIVFMSKKYLGHPVYDWKNYYLIYSGVLHRNDYYDQLRRVYAIKKKNTKIRVIPHDKN